MLVCTACKETKQSDQFYRKQRKCRVCMAAASREWSRANPARGMLRSARQRAKRLGVPFTITLEDIHIPEVCPVLGIEIKGSKSGTQGPTQHSPSIDRIVPSKGYTPENIIVVSFKANQIKSSATPKEIRRVAEFYERLTDL